MSSSNPKQKPCGELNCPLLGPNCPNLQRICMGLTLFVLGITGPDDVAFVDTKGLIVSGIIPSSGVDNKGEVEEDTPPKPFNTLDIFKDGEFGRTSIPLPFDMVFSKYIRHMEMMLYK